MIDDILETLKAYLDDPAVVMSRRIVNDTIAEIERLRRDLSIARDSYGAMSKAWNAVCAERDAERERADAHYRALENVTAKNERLRAELAAVRKQHDANGKASRDRAEHIYKLRTKLNAAEAERDSLRANLRDELERADAWHKTFLETQKHNEELRAENEKLRDAVNGKLFDKALLAALSNRLADRDFYLGQLEKAVDALTAERDEAVRRANNLSRDLDRDIRLYQAERDALRELLQEAYICLSGWDEMMRIRIAAVLKGESDARRT